jgi:hypothetical protein
MIAVATPLAENISANLSEKDECTDEREYSIDTEKTNQPSRWPLGWVQSTTTIPEASCEGDDWIAKAWQLVCQIAGISNNWDGEGGPRPDPGVTEAAELLLSRLRMSRLGAIPVPFVCPISGGGIQFEWNSPKKHLEIEFLDTSTIAFLKEELTPQGESTETGEYPLWDAESTRQLLYWFAAV